MINLKNIFSAVKKIAGHSNSIYLVGGYVRDTLLGKATKDIDFVVSQSPEKTARKLAEILHAPCITLDEHYRIYRVIHPVSKQYFDFAQMQGKTIEEDLTRRDFTVNAITRNIIGNRDDTLIDPFDGVKDLKKKIIRFISEKAIPDDPVRLIRAFRFASELSFTIEQKSLKFIRKHSALITRSAGERIKDEISKICACSKSGRTFEQMDEARLLTQIFPELESGRRVARVYYPEGGVLHHCLDTVNQMDFIIENTSQLFGKIQKYIHNYLTNSAYSGFPLYASLKLAALLHDIGKPSTAKRIKGRLRFFLHEEAGANIIKHIGMRLRMSRKETHLLQTIARAHMRPGNLAYVEEITDRAIHRFFRDYGEEGIAVLLVSLADRFCYISRRKIGNKTDKHHRTILTLLNKYFLKKQVILPPKIINGQELMDALHLTESPLIGKLLNAVYEAQSEGLIKTKLQAFDYARTELAPIHTNGDPRA